MEITEDNIRKIASLIIVMILGLLALFVIRPILLAIIGGLLMAYVFYPVFVRINSKIKSRSLSSLIVVLSIILIILIPLIIIAPTLRLEIAHLFLFFQSFDITPVMQKILPASSEQVVLQITTKVQGLVTKEIGTIFDSIPQYILNFILDTLVILLVFFFGLRDGDKLRSFAASISGFSKSREEIIVNKFKDITDSIIYGHVVVGIFQGLLAGLALLIFGIPNVFVLTVVAIVVAIIPFVGTPIIWIPATIYLFSLGRPTAATIYLLFNLIVVSTVDNVIRAYIVSKKSNLSEAIVLVGMIGGGIIFGFVGLVLGPLILAYFITFLSLHRDKKSKGNIFFE